MEKMESYIFKKGKAPASEESNHSLNKPSTHPLVAASRWLLEQRVEGADCVNRDGYYKKVRVEVR